MLKSLSNKYKLGEGNPQKVKKMKNNPKLDNACCDIYIYGLYPYRYSLDAELYGLH